MGVVVNWKRCSSHTTGTRKIRKFIVICAKTGVYVLLYLIIIMTLTTQVGRSTWICVMTLLRTVSRIIIFFAEFPIFIKKSALKVFAFFSNNIYLAIVCYSTLNSKYLPYFVYKIGLHQYNTQYERHFAPYLFDVLQHSHIRISIEKLDNCQLIRRTEFLFNAYYLLNRRKSNRE
jgi:hypothetical protein